MATSIKPLHTCCAVMQQFPIGEALRAKTYPCTQKHAQVWSHTQVAWQCCSQELYMSAVKMPATIKWDDFIRRGQTMKFNIAKENHTHRYKKET